jgi:pilus assembly protein CpaB
MKWQLPVIWRLRPEWLVGAMALVAGVAGAFLANRYVTQRTALAEERLTERYAPRSIVVAATDIKAGDIIKAPGLAARNVPTAFVPNDAVASEEVDSVLATRAAIDIKRGSPIQLAALRAVGGNEGLASALEGGRRALTIAVDQINSLDGQLAAGDYVDIVLSQTEGTGARLTPLLQRVQVLAAGGQIHGVTGSSQGLGEQNINTVTFSLTSEEAARLILAEQVGDISVLLRAPQDARPLDIRLRHSSQLQGQAVRSSTAMQRAERVELLIGGVSGGGLDRRWSVVGMASETVAKGSL